MLGCEAGPITIIGSGTSLIGSATQSFRGRQSTRIGHQSGGCGDGARRGPCRHRHAWGMTRH